jgi:hypothetical protein
MGSGGSLVRTRWAAIGAALAVAVGSGGLLAASAAGGTSQRSVFVPITPCRVMDTRAPSAVGPRTSPLGAHDTYSITVRGTNGNCTIPAEAVGLSMNVTTVNATGASFLSVFPSDVALPTASNLNMTPGQSPTPNAVTTNISADGKISFYNDVGTVDVLADIVGYYASASLRYLPIDVFADVLIGSEITSLAPGEPFGHALDNGGAITHHFNFIAPFDVTPGSTMTFQAFYQASETNCTIAIDPISYDVSRVGVVVPGGVGAFAGITSIGPNPAAAPSVVFATGVVSFTMDAPTGGGLNPGDIISLLFRRGADSCNNAINVIGAQVTYS